MKVRFLPLSIFVLFFLMVSAATAQVNTLPNGVAAGDVTQTSAVLWTHSTASGSVTFEYATDEGFSSIAGTVTAEVTDGAIPVKVAVSDLTPNTAYYYRATDAAGNSAAGKFRTPAEVGEKIGLRFGISGDQRGELAPFPAIANVPERDLAFFVEFGDTIYADVPSPDVDKPLTETLADYRAKHNEVYSERYGLNTQAALRASTAVLVTTDDHEVINDFAGGAAPSTDNRFEAGDAEFINDTQRFEDGMQAFQEYNPIADEFYGDTGDARTANERKLYRYRTYGSDAAFFLLDARSFRDSELAGPSEFTSEALDAYFASTFDPARTMLGQAQLDDLKADLTSAQQAAITWKFILVPEPIQNLGPVASGDRFEGYAAERTELLKFVVESGISNVVFVSADIHGTIINNLTYQEAAGGEQIPTGSFELSTGPIAYDAPFGPTVFNLAHSLGFVSDQQLKLYNTLPVVAKELAMKQLIDAQVTPFGYDPVGLDGSDINIVSSKGGWLATSVYGWTEFEIDAATQELHIIVYGMPPYTKEEMDADPAKITTQEVKAMIEFTVSPK